MPLDISSSGPAFSFEIKDLIFTDGTSIPVEQGATLIITGPNNSGKSISLREIQVHLHKTIDPGVVSVPRAVRDVRFALNATPHQIAEWLRSRYPSAKQQNGIEYFQLVSFAPGAMHGGGGGFAPVQPGFNLVPNSLIPLTQALLLRLDTQSRLQIASRTQSAQYTTTPGTYIHFLQRDNELAEQVSALVSSAFCRDLIINFGGGQQVWFHVGVEPARGAGVDRVSPEYVRALELQPLLDDEGDGIRSFIGTLLAARVGSHPVILIDEPEAFLHPPQARRLGYILAESAKTGNRQMVIATHSSDFIQGAMDASQNVVVCRMVRDGDVNRVSVLSRDDLKALWSKPLLRSSVAIDGLFHSGVVVCEGDSDCRFYEALALREEQTASRPMDLYFVHGGGKGAAATLAQTYTPLKVPTAVIADLDLLRRKEEFLKLYEVLGGDVAAITALYTRVQTALNGSKPLISAAEFVDRIAAVLQRVSAAKKLGPEDRRKMREDLEAASDWSEVKKYGISKLNGAELTAGKELLAKCAEVGLFLCPCGVLERWWPEGPQDKAEWIAMAIPKIAEDVAVFEGASRFVAGVCEYLGGRYATSAAQGQGA